MTICISSHSFRNGLAYGVLAALMLTLFACQKKDADQPPNQPAIVVGDGAVMEMESKVATINRKVNDIPDVQKQLYLDPIAQTEALNALGYNPPTRALVVGGKSRSKKVSARLSTRLQDSFGGSASPGGVAHPVDGEDPSSTENYQPIFENDFQLATKDPLSTFSTSVDTASYSNIRRFLNEGKLPPKDSIRIADMINYFSYDYPAPKNDDPVAFSLEIAPCPWDGKHHLLRIALQAKVIDKEKMPARNLVFLVDTSGSMQGGNRLPLVQQSLRLLVEQLTPNDKVSIVTYAGAAGLALGPTPGDQKEVILKVIEGLSANGSTNGEGGLKAAYAQAELSFMKDGINRVILATDGDFNVGISSDAEMVRLIEKKRETGVYLTVLGYGMGNLKDSKLEQLAHHGNGHYAYIDTLEEAKKVFVEQGASMVTVAKDVKLQVEFNPAKIAAYRLIGYENRILKAEDFRNDAKDAGDMGSGHTCTALYEIVPVGEQVTTPSVEPLKYQTTAQLTDVAKSGEWMTVRMRYKHPETNKAQEVSSSLEANALKKEASKDFQFAACVASFGMVLRDSDYKADLNYKNVFDSTEKCLGEDKNGYRAEFHKLVRLALSIDQNKK